MQTAALKMDNVTSAATATFLAFASDSTTSGILMEAASLNGFDEASVVPVGQNLDKILSTLNVIPTPKILIVDLSETEDLMSSVGALANVCDPDSRVIIIGQVNDVNIYRTLIDEGVYEYLVKPVTVERITDAIQRVQREPVATAPEAAVGPVNEMRRIAFVGVHGGAGASMLAANCAWALSTDHKQTVSLIDLDLTFGTLALQMDTEPGKGLSDALESPSRIDDLFLKRALIPYTETLHLLASESDPGNLNDINAAAIGVLFEHMMDSYDSVILDIPRDHLIRQPVFLGILDEVVLVSEPSLVGLRDATRIARMIGEKSPETPVRVALNRVGLVPNADLTTEVFTKNSNLEVIAEVPFDAKVVAHAVAKGRVIVDADKRSKIAAAMKSLAHKLMPEGEVEEESRSLWSRLAKRG